MFIAVVSVPFLASIFSPGQPNPTVNEAAIALTAASTAMDEPCN